MRLRRIFVAVFGLAAAVHAATIVSTFGPGQTFQPPPGLTIGGGVLRGDPPPNQGVTQAFQFGTAVSSQLTQVDLALRYFSIPGAAGGPANLDVSIESDNLGKPGTAIETIHLTNVLGSVSFTPGIVTATSVSHPVLAAGTPYWLVVAPPDLLNTAFDWLISPNPSPTQFATRLGNGAWITGVTPQPLAFDVIGGPASSTPEPFSGVLIATGVAAFCLLRRSQHRST